MIDSFMIPEEENRPLDDRHQVYGMTIRDDTSLARWSCVEYGEEWFTWPHKPPRYCPYCREVLK